MSYQSKKLWEDVFNGIDSKFTDEAAEMLKKAAPSDKTEDFPDAEKPLEIKPQQMKRSRAPLFAGLAAAAAAVAITVGIFAGRLQPPVVSEPEPVTSEANRTDETSETRETEEIRDDTDEPYISHDLPVLTEDTTSLHLGIFEQHFMADWEDASGESMLAGYFTVNYHSFDMEAYDDGTALEIGFLEDENGWYMARFLYKNKMPTGLMNVYFVPAENPNKMYFFQSVEVGKSERVFTTMYNKVGDAEDIYPYGNSMTLAASLDNYGISWRDIMNISFTDENNVTWTVNPDRLSRVYINSDNSRIDGEESVIEFSVICSPYDRFKKIRHVFQSGKFTFADESLNGNEAALYQPAEATENLDKWEIFERYISMRAVAADGKHIVHTYSDLLSSTDSFEIYSTRDSWRMEITGSSGATQLILVPKNNLNRIYTYENYLGENDTRRLCDYDAEYLRESYLGTEELVHTGVISDFGLEKLYHDHGEGLKDVVEFQLESWRVGADGRFSDMWFNFVPDNSAKMMLTVNYDNHVVIALPYQRYYSGAGTSTTAADGPVYLLYIFENHGKWEYTGFFQQNQTDTGLDLRPNERIDTDVYEECFLGRWTESGSESDLVFSYFTDENGIPLCGMIPQSVYQGADGWYMYGGSISTSAERMLYYIPYYDREIMYIYTGRTDEELAARRMTSQDGTRTAVLVEKHTFDSGTLDAGGFINSAAIEKLKRTRSSIFDAELDAMINHSYTDSGGLEWKPLVSVFDLAVCGNISVYLAPRSMETLTFTINYYAIIDGHSRVVPITHTLTETGSGINHGIRMDNGFVRPEPSTGTGEMDFEMFEAHFAGTWSSGQGEYYLNYDRDSFSGASGVGGFYENSSGWYMFDGEDITSVLYIPKSLPDMMYYYPSCVYPNEYSTFYRTDDAVSEIGKGEISLIGLEKMLADYNSASLYYLLDNYMNPKQARNPSNDNIYPHLAATELEQTVLELNYDKWKYARKGGEKMYLTERSDTKFGLVLPFYVLSEFDSTGKVAEDVQPLYVELVIENTAGTKWETTLTAAGAAELISPTEYPADESGSYFIASDGGSHGHCDVYYREKDSCFYRLLTNRYTKMLYPIAQVKDGSLYVLCAINDYPSLGVYLTRFVNGQAWGCTYLGSFDSDYEDTWHKSVRELRFCGDYIAAGWNNGTEDRWDILDPMGINGPVSLMQEHFISLSENGNFSVYRDGAYKEYITDGSSLEGILPLLCSRLDNVWSLTQVCCDNFFSSYGSDSPTFEINGRTMYKTNSPMFYYYSDLVEYMEYAFTPEYTAEYLSTISRIGEKDGLLYSTGGARGGRIFTEREYDGLTYIDDTHAELHCSAYKFAEQPDGTEIRDDEPYEQFVLPLVKTENGWKFELCYSPF